MSNSYFKFKEFTIHQDRCAMKVCTDACILGAWFAKRASEFQKVLDIGSGTGLQMLMLAQKSTANIDGIEIDSEAYKQLAENIAASSWQNRLRAFEGDVKTFDFESRYDFIISNPPFFENDLLSPSGSRQNAMHSTTLNFHELLRCINNNLLAEGSFGVLLPFHRWQFFQQLAAEAGYYLKESLRIRQSPTHDPFRMILHFSRESSNRVIQHELVIHDCNRQYTAEFTALLKDFYLKL